MSHSNMGSRFVAEPEPSVAQLDELTALAPANPFITPAYLRAKAALGLRPWLLGIRSAEGKWIAGCLAFVTPNRLLPTLRVPSVPALGEAASIFWRGLVDFCESTGLCAAHINTAFSPPGKLPEFPRERLRRSRYEYVLDLTTADLRSGISTNHLRNIKRAQKNGIVIERTGTEQSCRQHAALVSASLKRRKNRGERLESRVDDRRTLPYLTEGAGEIFRALRGGKVLSSVLVLMAPEGGYYQSAGTNAEGMACGACHLLVYEIARNFQAAGKRQFNLGGAAPENSGLQQFKAGFGAARVELEAVEIVLGSAVRHILVDQLRSLRGGWQQFTQFFAPPFHN